MNVLLVYATREGQTRKIARFVAEQLVHLGHQVEILDATAAGAAVDPSRFGAVIIAAPVHAGRYPSAIVQFVLENSAAIDSRPNAFLSVSLAAASHDPNDVAGIRRCVEKFTRHTGWRPQRTHHIAGALRYTSYGLLERWALRYIAYRRGGPTDTRRDHELTDWPALARLVGEAFPAI